MGRLWNRGSHRQRLHFLGAMGNEPGGSSLQGILQGLFPSQLLHLPPAGTAPFAPSCATPTVSAQSQPELPESQQLLRELPAVPNTSTQRTQGMLPGRQQELQNSALMGPGRTNPKHVSIIIFLPGTHGLVVSFSLHEVTPRTLPIVPVNERQVRLNPVRLNPARLNPEHSQTVLDEFSEVGSCSTNLSGMQSSPGLAWSTEEPGQEGKIRGIPSGI